MKCLSLWQPWASAIAVRMKRVETRSWPTKYRGPLLIHAAKTWRGVAIASKQMALWYAVFGHTRLDDLPRGAVIASCVLHDVRHVDTVDPDPIERQLGDFSDGRFGWILRHVVRFPEPLPIRGRQGLFDVDFERELGGVSP
ncbi:MAG: ASCH domain-containing protein [Planctomycetes bacterium]|nr:ASCH domain-containing protein [Planctomycetota bacterium]